MDLSTAIRLGAEKRPQREGMLFGTLGGILASCALGAAYEGYTGHPLRPFNTNDRLVGIRVSDEHTEAALLLHETFPILLRDATCPACPDHVRSVSCTVTHLNDEHEWSRERIADWVETL